VAGALLVVRDGEPEVQASHRLEGATLVSSSLVALALRTARIELTELTHDLVIDAAAVTFRPAAVAVVPIRFKDVPVGAFVLAYSSPPNPERIRLLGALRDPTGVALNNALAHERFQRLAAVDPLTGAYNRRFGFGRLNEEFARSVRSGAPLGLLAFDLDHFKAVNDAYGHLVGDQVLREVTEATRTALRDGDVLVRSGGEEFLVLLPGAGPRDVEHIGERLRRRVAAVAVPTAEGDVKITVSLGGASFPRTEASRPEDLLEKVDRAVYRSKEQGRDRLSMHFDVQHEPQSA
jgi:two-component system, cell cycle response regulator